MNSYGSLGGYGDGSSRGVPEEGRERGARRKKFAGYLKAANELRQSYQQSASEQWARRRQEETYFGNDDHGIPEAFPEVPIVRSEDEEMVLFRSYARRHVKGDMDQAQSQPYSTDVQSIKNGSSGDADYWKLEWEKYEDRNAIVDVDVRGCIYAPHRGQMNRTQRMY